MDALRLHELVFLFPLPDLYFPLASPNRYLHCPHPHPSYNCKISLISFATILSLLISLPLCYLKTALLLRFETNQQKI